MVVNYEFLDDEPMDNLITCMNFEVDKAVYLGYHECILKHKKNTENFLSKYCGVKEVVFLEVPKYDLQKILGTLRSEVAQEKKKKNQVFFDVTGGEHLVLVAFGMLSRETETPMHMFNVRKDRLTELDEGAQASISRDAVRRKVPLTLDMLIEMHGGVINYNLHKDAKDVREPGFAADIERIYEVAVRHWDVWNPFSDLLERLMSPEPLSLRVSKDLSLVQRMTNRSGGKLNTFKRFNDIIKDLQKAGAIIGVNRSGGRFEFSYKSEAIRDCLWEGGAILELHTCIDEWSRNNECLAGVHVDWDGVIHDKGVDLTNEIDVLSLKGNVPTFISCKSGNLNAMQTLHALYELDTIANRFGGKYCKRVLVTARPLSGNYLERAAEMNIEVRSSVAQE